MNCIIALSVAVMLFAVVQSYPTVEDVQPIDDSLPMYGSHSAEFHHRQKRALCIPFGFSTSSCKSHCVHVAKEKGGRCFRNKCVCLPSHTPVTQF
uniref:Putative defensin rhodnius neglectus n=2 Tax=Rhodnius TaxID=13248 RepID=A0A4P6DAD7_RHOPR